MVLYQDDNYFSESEASLGMVTPGAEFRGVTLHHVQYAAKI